MSAIGPVHQVCDGLYTATASSSKGEIFYLGMERLDSKSRKKWKSYQNISYIFAFQHNNPLLHFFEVPTPGKIEEMTKSKEFSLREETASHYFTNVWNRIQGDEKKMRAFHDRSGVGAFLTEKEDDYVVYASKREIKGPLSFPEETGFSLVPDEKGEKKFTLQEILDFSHPIIMSVGVLLSEDEAVYRNRGIFRNPISFIEGGYEGISLDLHAFSGKVFRDMLNPQSPENKKDYMVVAPAPVMHSILVKAFDGQLLEPSIEEEELEKFSGKNIGDRVVLIKVEDLAAFHDGKVEGTGLWQKCLKSISAASAFLCCKRDKL